MAAGRIDNADGSIGEIRNASSYMMDNRTRGKYISLVNSTSTQLDNVGTLSSKEMNVSNKDRYRLLMGINSGGLNRNKRIISASGTKSPKQSYNPYLSRDTSSTSEETTNKNNVLFFMGKMQQYEFAPPSDNLWTVEFELDGGRNIIQLYQNVRAVNDSWTSKISSKWKVRFGNDDDNDDNNNTEKKIDPYSRFINHFVGNHGLFLAQSVNFTPLSVTTTNNFFSEIQQHGSFFNMGNIAQSRQQNSDLKISFLVSNWDIGDILFEPWIAAVAQRGLVQDGSSTIKARIVITEYASGHPLPQGVKITDQMIQRKQYIFHNCFPVSRNEVAKNYESGQAGKFKNTNVTFRYDDYEIKYLI